MENLVENVIKLNLDQIEEYAFPLDSAFGLEVDYNDIKFCFIIRFSSNNKNLICCGSGAQERDQTTSDGRLINPPYFKRWSWYKFFEESFIAYADPIFFKDKFITLGWYVGDRENWYLEIISEIIQKLLKNQKIMSNNVLFYSSSGGGFASVCLGALIKGSKVLINNSQLFILNFKKSHVDNLFRILENEFPELSKKEIIEKINYRLNTIELFKREQYIPPIHYYVNIESDEDIYDQCTPFMKEIIKLPQYNNNVTLFPYREQSNDPHWPLPVEESVNLVRSFSKQYLYNSVEEKNDELRNNLLESNKILRNQNQKLIESNKILNDLNQKLIESNKSLNDLNQKLVEFNK